MKYCTSKDLYPCILYTGDNYQEVLDFLRSFNTANDEYDYLLEGNMHYDPAWVGTWFVAVDNSFTETFVVRYKNAEDFFDYYSIKEGLWERQ